ncbi:VWA domain-containing protein [Plantactinospora sp. S1510]|uniref:VWA domain-containing protein n=1 Tax=Plantactinospora alkalitolerans TaxID=2789879 RepID=A0ABS0H4K9_9ACTN|nr:VWA domain-containing protein [Plantactinospora alkalitolerans]MBF9133401.1 VWA domain-containing protein [Plantactinospora alkalitolerans]
MADDESRSGKYRRLRVIVFALVALPIAGLGELLKKQASNSWLVLAGAMVVAAVSLWFTDIRRFVDWLLEWVEERYRAVSRRARWIAAGVLVLLVAATAVVVVRPFGDDDGCPPTTELRILTSPEGFQATRELAGEYARTTARANDGCPTVFPFVYAADTSAVSSALARQWADGKTEHPYVDLGPRPDAWLPDSTVDVRQVRDILARTLPDDLTANGRLPAPLKLITPIASSSIVLAGSAVPATPPDDAATLSGLVSRLLAKPKPSLSVADPESSTAGLLAATGYLHDAQNRLVDPAVARQRQQIVLASTASADDEASLLCAYLRTGRAPAAVLTSSRTWQRLLKGRTLGGTGCRAPVNAPWAPTSLTSEGVEGPVLDHPFVQFTWTSSRHNRAVDGFRDWLRGAGGRYLAEVGLAKPRNDCGALDKNPCVPEDLAATLELYQQAKLSGRVLLAVDASGSMTEGVGSGKGTRFTVATQGVVEALGQLGPHDEFGLWSFPNARGRSSPQLAGIAAGSPQHRKAVVGALRSVDPAGVTPLYATILAGLREVSGGGDAKRIRALVVLTDGEDTTSSLSLQQVAREVRKLSAASDVRLHVIATGDARCEEIPGREGTGLHLLTDAGKGECLSASPGKVPRTMAQLFTTLWSGR